jgi:beta-glucosidase/6-phospho-beta-glucosidase/beta-galactosidase
VINPQTSGLITGNIGAVDPDGDPLTYTVIGRPHNGGTLEVDEDGNFTYRPMNAMAAVGGVDQFTVVVSDEAAGLHVHGPLGLLKFVPILGNFINPGAGDAVAQTITVNVDPVAGVDLSFPSTFHWGVAHAGFQAEGGPGSPVDPNSDWYKWVHDPINQLLGLTQGVPENGPGTYVSYDTDAQLAHDDLGMDTFRMSIEWSRIFSNSTASIDISDEGGTVSLADLQAMDAIANQNEVAHYRAVFASLRAHGLEPLVTVNHFTLPAWVNDPIAARALVQLGLPAPAAGWLSPSTPAEFEKYAAYVAWKYGDQVDNWTVLNEPVPPVLTQYLSIPGVVPSWPPGVIRPDLASTFLVNEAKGYVAAYDAIHLWDNTVATAGQPEAFVGFANNMIPARPANPVNPLDVQAADAWNDFYNHWFPNAVIEGWVDANLDGIKTPDEIHPDFVDKADFIGVQYYGSQPMQGFGVAPVPGFPWLQGLPGRCAAESPTCSDFNQPTDPGGFREVLEVAASYDKPIWITENGIADAGDSKRPSYIVNHIAVVQDLVAHGMDIRGYTYWSLVDNLEWANGYDLNFGLYGSDPTTPELERDPKPASIAAISAITKSPSHSLPIDLLTMYIPNTTV